MHVDTKMKYVHALKVVYEGIELGPGKYGEFSAPPTVDLTYVIWRQFIGKKQCMSQQTKLPLLK